MKSDELDLELEGENEVAENDPGGSVVENKQGIAEMVVSQPKETSVIGILNSCVKSEIDCSIHVAINVVNDCNPYMDGKWKKQIEENVKPIDNADKMFDKMFKYFSEVQPIRAQKQHHKAPINKHQENQEKGAKAGPTSFPLKLIQANGSSREPEAYLKRTQQHPHST
ncbi:hypothetical protein U1Q18_037767 [Sarracenia purpurea var. burkii]